MTGAYDAIPQDKLLEVVANTIRHSESMYCIRQYAVVRRDSQGQVHKSFRRQVRPEWTLVSTVSMSVAQACSCHGYQVSVSNMGVAVIGPHLWRVHGSTGIHGASDHLSDPVYLDLHELPMELPLPGDTCNYPQSLGQLNDLCIQGPLQ